jgi:hypothetical protein
MELLLLLLGAGLLLKGKAAAGEKIDYDVKSFEISKGKLYLIFTFINPTYVSQKVDSLNLKIMSGENIVGRIDHFDVINLPARQKTSVKMVVTVKAFDLGTVIAQIYQGKIKSFDVKGTYLSMGFSIPVEKTVSL